jgi:hypothetical protein
MKCAVHTEVEATGYCRNCGKALCAECARDVRGVLYCESCLADLVTKPAVATGQPVVGGPSPALAALLGFVPGLGAVYNGQYMKALVHVVIFASLIGFVTTDIGERTQPAGGLSIAGFVIYMAIEAHRTAKAKLLGLPCTDPFGSIGGKVPIGPLILIGLGVLFLLDKFNYLPLERIFEFWPVFLILLGAYLLWRRMGSRSTGS